jgi:hypothetical protein
MSWPNPSVTRWLYAPTKAVVEDGLVLPIGRLMRGIAGEGSFCQGKWGWKIDDDKQVATIAYRGDVFSASEGMLRLFFSVKGERVEQCIPLQMKPCVFGGGRWFAICPSTARAVCKLYLHAGSQRFVSRHAAKMTYRSQRLDRAERAILRRERLVSRRRLGDSICPTRPKWMRKATFERLLMRIENLDKTWEEEAKRRFGVTSV